MNTNTVSDADADMAAARNKQDNNFVRITNAIQNHAKKLSKFISIPQLKSLISNIRGEEGGYFLDTIERMRKLIDSMPKTYEQDGLGDDAIVYLHYFIGSADWYVTEKDMETDQIQAFGYASLYGDGSGELGCLNIEEIIASGAEIDLHWTPKTLREVYAKNNKSAPIQPLL